MERADKIGLILAYVGVIILTLICMTSAETIYAGETFTQDLDFEIVNCSIIDNTYNLEGLNLSWNNTNVTISTVPNYKPDNLTISCLVIKYKDVIEEEYIYRSRGSSCIYNKSFNWGCGEWSECTNENQTRICKKYNNCHNTYGKPNETQICTSEIIGNETDEHGCMLMAGYIWCEAKQKCLREWEEDCEESTNWKQKIIAYLLIGLSLVVVLVIYKIIDKKRQKKRKKGKPKIIK